VVTERNPAFRTVTVANNVRIPVAAIGSITLQVTTSTGKCRPIVLSNVLVVPGLKVRLFSCRWGYEHDGIETLLNAERCLKLADGTLIPFLKHGNNYAINTCHADLDGKKDTRAMGN